MKPLAYIAVLVPMLSAVTMARGTTASARPDEHQTYRHAYYLFLAEPPSGFEDCYVPLLITTESLEKVAKKATKAGCVLITTYERDSVWNNEGLFEIVPGDIRVSPRIIQFRGRKYRYQEISAVEAIRLLENPLGTIPISRPFVKPLGSPGPPLRALVDDLRRIK